MGPVPRRRMPPWPSGNKNACCLFAATFCVATFECMHSFQRKRRTSAFMQVPRPAVREAAPASRVGGESARYVYDSSSLRAVDAARQIPSFVGAALLAFASRAVLRGVRHDPQRTALGASRVSKVVCVATSATPTATERRPTQAPTYVPKQRVSQAHAVIRASATARLATKMVEAQACCDSVEIAATNTCALNPVARLKQHVAKGGTRPRSHRRGALFTGAAAGAGSERRQRRRHGARLQRSAFPPLVESYDPSRLRTAIQAGQQRANSLRVANGREWQAPATNGSSVCRVLSSTRIHYTVMSKTNRRLK